MRPVHIAIVEGLRDALLPQTRRRRNRDRLRLLQHQQLEQRCVLTLPATQTFAEGDLVAYNGPSVDLVNDTQSFDAFIDFAGDVDSYYFAPQFSGTYTIDVGDFGNAVDPEVAVYNASTGAQVGYNDDLSAFNDDARLVLNLVADVRYIIAVADMPSTTAGNVSIVVSAPFRTGSFLLTPDAFGDASTSVLLDVPTDIDYYSITAPADATGVLSVVATGSAFNQRLALFDSAGTLLQGPLVSINYSNANPSQEYRIAVFSNNYATFGSLNLLVNFAQSGAAVTNTLDDGPGSLRQAILDANAHPNDPGVPDKIRFAIPGAGPFTISLASALPFITEAVDIDGRTQPGTGATPTVAIDGTALAGAIDGLRINADGTSIRQLNIRKFPSDGIEVQASGVLLKGNTIGTDWGGSAAFGNAGNGIQILDGDSTIVSGNVISGNTLAGVVLTGSATSNTLTGNKIGTKFAGNVALPNGGDGILIQSSGNQVGGNQVALRNVISGNAKNGITISGAAASNNVIEGNVIGTNLNGNAAVPNSVHGILIANAPNNRVGSATDASARNVISGNAASGVTFTQAGASGGLVVGNFIGVALNGTVALGNTGNGVLLTTGATNVQIGGTTGLSQNVVSANGANGISILNNANGNRVSRNRIGTTAAGAALGNVGSGIFVQSSGNTIGGANANFANVIAGNAQGISFSGAAAINNTISFNTIGTDTASNVGRGIQFVSGASNNTVGPSNTIRRNETGILINNGSVGNKITHNSISENINLGIDLLSAAGANANDAADADTGGNLLQNWPAISGSPLQIGADLEIAFSVPSSPANSAYPLTIEFFVSDGGGEGAKFLGSTIYTAANFAAGVKTVSFTGAGTGLTPGTSKIVGIATDLNGNTSEFSTQRNVASGGAMLIASARKTGNSLDVNKDGVVSRTDALQLITFLKASSAVSDNRLILNAVPPTQRYDTSGDRVVSSLDVLLVVRGLRENNPTAQNLPSVKQLEDKAFWDSILSELNIDDRIELASALS